MAEARKIAVTGANGFIGSHCVIALLQAGFDVVAVVRDSTNTTKTQFQKNEAAMIGKADHLFFGSGDLTKSGSYDEAFQGCWGIVHNAAAVKIGLIKDPYETVVKPTVQGTKNIIASVKANSNTIQRFVNIASTAAVVSADKASDMYIFSESDWNTWSTVEKGDAYGYAKTEAEKVVFLDKNLKQCVSAVVSINPSVVLGPCFTKSHAEGTSPQIVTGCLRGMMTPDVNMNFVDVRDVAKGVTLAFTNNEKDVAGQRFILNATDATSIKELGTVIQEAYPAAKGFNKLAMYPLTLALAIVVWLGMNFPILQKVGYREAFGYYELTKNAKLDNTKSKTVLGIGNYRTIQETCKDAAESIAELISTKTE